MFEKKIERKVYHVRSIIIEKLNKICKKNLHNSKKLKENVSRYLCMYRNVLQNLTNKFIKLSRCLKILLLIGKKNDTEEFWEREREKDFLRKKINFSLTNTST